MDEKLLIFALSAELDLLKQRVNYLEARAEVPYTEEPTPFIDCCTRLGDRLARKEARETEAREAREKQSRLVLFFKRVSPFKNKK